MLAGADLGATYLRLSLLETEPGPRLVGTRKFPVPNESDGVSELRWVIATLTAELSTHKAAALGLSAAPLVDQSKTVLEWPNRPHWNGLSLLPLSGLPGCDPLIVHDGLAGAVGEWILGAGRGSDNLAYVAAGTGVCAGLILGGRPWQGVHGWAGELGHSIIDYRGNVCRCGRRGCVQSVAAGSPVPALTAGIINIVMLLDIDTVVLGGGMATGVPSLVEETARCLAGVLGRRCPSVRRSELGDYAAAVGAALLAGSSIQGPGLMPKNRCQVITGRK